MFQFDKNTTTKHSIWRPYHLFLVVGLVMIFIIIYMGNTTGNIIYKNAPRADAAGEVRVEIILAHLSFEEILNKNHNEHTTDDIYFHTERAKQYLDALLNGSTQTEFTQILPLNDTSLILEVQAIQDKLQTLETLITYRLDTIESLTAEPPIDQEFDALTLDLSNQTSQLEKALKKQNRNRIKTSQNTQYGLIVLVLLLSLVAWMVARRYEKSRDATLIRLKSAKEHVEKNRQWLYTTMNSMGDAVIITDTQGKVNLINPVAEKLTGWSQKKARGKDLSQIFHIINEDTQAPAENPFGKIIRDKIVVGLANHTALITKDGKIIPIADSGAPILDDENNLLHHPVLIFG